MPKISGEIILKCSKEKVFNEMTSVDFTKKLDPSLANLNVEILFQNERLIHTLTKLEKFGNIVMEKVKIPENFTILSQRKPPMMPFVYFLGLQILDDYKDGSILKWTEEFEIDAENKAKEEGIVSRLEQNEILHFQKVQNYFNNGNQ
jgi:hypothetical protein